MTKSGEACAGELGLLIDYLLGELPPGEEQRLEAHLFECPVCAARAESIERIGASIGDLVRHAGVGASVNGAFLERAIQDGLTLREYRIPAGETVSCTAGPEDLVVVRLEAEYGGSTELELDVAFHDLESGETAPVQTRPVVADHELGEIVLVFPGEVVRSYPRSRWTLRVHGSAPSGRTDLGQFVMDHMP